MACWCCGGKGREERNEKVAEREHYGSWVFNSGRLRNGFLKNNET